MGPICRAAALLLAQPGLSWAQLVTLLSYAKLAKFCWIMTVIHCATGIVPPRVAELFVT